MSSRTFVLALLIVLALPTAAWAQICRGSAPLAGMWRGNVNGSTVLFEGGRTTAGGATVGSSLFGSGSFSRQAYTDPAGLHLDMVAGAVGYEFTPEGSPVSLCPVLGGGYGFGYEFAGGDLSTVVLSAGLGFGYKAEVEPNVFVVPAAELSLVRESQTADLGAAGSPTNQDYYGSLAISLGFLMFRQRVSAGPIVQIPISSNGGSVTLGVGAAFSIGGGP